MEIAGIKSRFKPDSDRNFSISDLAALLNGIPLAFIRQYIQNMEDQGFVSFIRRFTRYRRAGSGAMLGSLPGDDKILKERERFRALITAMIEAWRKEFAANLHIFVDRLHIAVNTAIKAVDEDITRLEAAVKTSGYPAAALLEQRRRDKQALVEIRDETLPTAVEEVQQKEPPPTQKALEAVQEKLEKTVSANPILSKTLYFMKQAGDKASNFTADVSGKLGTWLRNRAERRAKASLSEEPFRNMPYSFAHASSGPYTGAAYAAYKEPFSTRANDNPASVDAEIT